MYTTRVFECTTLVYYRTKCCVFELTVTLCCPELTELCQCQCVYYKRSFFIFFGSNNLCIHCVMLSISIVVLLLGLFCFTLAVVSFVSWSDLKYFCMFTLTDLLTLTTSLLHDYVGYNLTMQSCWSLRLLSLFITWSCLRV